jgi:hypothetical protein
VRLNAQVKAKQARPEPIERRSSGNHACYWNPFFLECNSEHRPRGKRGAGNTEKHYPVSNEGLNNGWGKVKQEPPNLRIVNLLHGSSALVSRAWRTLCLEFQRRKPIAAKQYQ